MRIEIKAQVPHTNSWGHQQEAHTSLMPLADRGVSQGCLRVEAEVFLHRCTCEVTVKNVVGIVT